MSTRRWMLSVLLLIALLAPGVLAPAPAHAGGVVTVCDEAHLLTALAGGGTVTFACSGTITLTNTIPIAVNTTIDGSGQNVTISGNDTVRVFVVEPGATFTLSGLTVVDGFAATGGGGAVDNHWGAVIVTHCTFSGNHAGGGGAIANSHGTVTVSNSVLSDNSATAVGGAIYAYEAIVNVSDSAFSNNWSEDGGAICSFGSTLIVRGSTFSDNSAGHGGAVSSGLSLTGMIDVSNSTFAGNHAAGYGGGIYSTIAMTVSNSTLSGNSAAEGGGIYGQATLRNTMIVNSPIGENCAGTFNDGGGNISFPDTSCPGINADPLLGPLQDNGGPTWTMALGAGSAALDAGDDAICAAPPVNNLDQRGITRPQGAHCDSGAVEQIIQPTAVSLSTMNASNASRVISPMLIFALLLASLAGAAKGNGNRR